MSLSTPRSAGADEPMHQATSWYVIHHGNTANKSFTAVSGIPKSLSIPACYAFNSGADASCMPDPNSTSRLADSMQIYNYPPLYYAIVGFGQTIWSKVFGLSQVDVGGRITSSLANILILWIAYVRLQKRNNKSGLILAMIATPMMSFYWSVVNPTGWEISTGILFAVISYEYCGKLWAKTKLGDTKKQEIIMFGVSGFLFASARPISILWLVMSLHLIAIGYGFTLKKLYHRMIIIPLLPALLFSAIFNLLKGNSIPTAPGYVPVETNLQFYVLAFLRSVMQFPDRLLQMFGNLGWLDTPLPQLFFLIAIVVWVVAISSRVNHSKNNFRFFLTLGIYSVVVPSLFEIAYWNKWPAWWHGRYTLPILTASLVIFLLNSKSNSTKTDHSLLCLSTFLNVFMILENLFRYSFGISNYMPLRLQDPAVGLLRFNGTLLSCFILIIIWSMLMKRTVHVTSVTSSTLKSRNSEIWHHVQRGSLQVVIVGLVVSLGLVALAYKAQKIGPSQENISVSTNQNIPIGPMTSDKEFRQSFTTSIKDVQSIIIYVATYGQKNLSGNAVFKIYGQESNVLFRAVVPLTDLRDNTYLSLETENLQLEPGQQYQLSATSDVPTGQNSYALWINTLALNNAYDFPDLDTKRAGSLIFSLLGRR